MGKGVKIFLFFWDFGGGYVRFWLRILPILTRQTAWRASAEKAAMSTDFDAPLENRRHVSNGVN